MSGRSRPIRIAGSALLPALLLFAGREACAQQFMPNATQQVVLTTTQGLDFGRFVAVTGGTVTVSPAGTASNSSGVILLKSPSPRQAIFSVNKSGNGSGKSIIITLPPDGSVQLTGPGVSMAVNGFVSSPTTLLSIPNGGTTLSVGATLTVNLNQRAGSYSGSFPLTINYQ